MEQAFKKAGLYTHPFVRTTPYNMYDTLVIVNPICIQCSLFMLWGFWWWLLCDTFFQWDMIVIAVANRYYISIIIIILF